MSQNNLIPIGGIYTAVSPKFQRGLYEGGVRCLKSSTHDNSVVLEVKVKEATKQGFQVAGGGARFRQPLDAGKQNKKRTSWGRYGEYIRH